MGGGATLFRGVAKAAVGAGIPVGRTALANATTSAVGGRCVGVPLAPVSTLPSQTLQYSNGMADDWELTGDEERAEYAVRDHLVFGSAPTTNEVEEATSELQQALSLCLDDPQQRSPSENATPTSLESADHVHYPVVDWIEPHLVSHNSGCIQVGRSQVADALFMLRNDPEVQGVVMSIAGDKAVWDAILKNEKLIEFRKKLIDQGGVVSEEDAEKSSNEEGEESLMDQMKKVYLNIKSALSEMINGLIAFVDKKTSNNNNSNEEEDSVTKTMKSCFMLAVVVVSIVVFKRVAIV